MFSIYIKRVRSSLQDCLLQFTQVYSITVFYFSECVAILFAAEPSTISPFTPFIVSMYHDASTKFTAQGKAYADGLDGNLSW